MLASFSSVRRAKGLKGSLLLGVSYRLSKEMDRSEEMTGLHLYRSRGTIERRETQSRTIENELIVHYRHPTLTDLFEISLAF
jgi:hypothetical protein